MKKKDYLEPLVCVALYNTQEMMKVSETSPMPDDPGTTPAPKREVYLY